MKISTETDNGGLRCAVSEGPKNKKVTKPSKTIKISNRKYAIQTMTKSNKKRKSQTNLSTKNIVSTKSSSPSTTPKSATTTPKLTATPKLLNSETPALPYSSTPTTTMEDGTATINYQDEKIQSLTKQVLHLESTLCEMQSQSLITMNTSDLLKLELDKLRQYSRRSCLVVSGV